MAHVQKRNQGGKTTWRARVRLPDGRKRSRSFDRKVDAERWVVETHAELNRGNVMVGAGSAVELGDGIVGEGDHHGVGSVALGGGPVDDHLIEEDVGVRAQGEAAGSFEPGDGALGAPSSEVEGDLAFVVVELAAVLDEPGCAEAAVEGWVETAGLDRWQLLGVADEDELGVRPIRDVDEPGDVPGPDHRRFIADDHRAVGDAETAFSDVAEKLGDGVGGDAAVGVESGGGSGGEGATDDVVAGGVHDAALSGHRYFVVR